MALSCTLNPLKYIRIAVSRTSVSLTSIFFFTAGYLKWWWEVPSHRIGSGIFTVTYSMKSGCLKNAQQKQLFRY